jgi:hypothetical protein
LEQITVVSLGYVIGLPIGVFLALIDWKALFLISSLLTLACLVFLLKIANIKRASSIGLGALGPSLVLSGIIIFALSIWAGIFLMVIGLMASFRIKLPGEYVKSSIDGFLHSITRNSFAAFFSMHIFDIFHFSLVSLYSFLLCHSRSFRLPGETFYRFNRKSVPALDFLAMAILATSIFIDTILAEILLGAASGLATTSNSSYIMNSLNMENRVVGSALRILQGTVSMSIGLIIGSIISIGLWEIVLILVSLNLIAATVVLSNNFTALGQIKSPSP